MKATAYFELPLRNYEWECDCSIIYVNPMVDWWFVYGRWTSRIGLAPVYG